MKILIISPGNPFNHRAWSGTLFYLTKTIENLGHTIIWHGEIPRASTLFKVKLFIKYLFTGKKIRWKHSIEYAKRIGQLITKRIKNYDYDLAVVIAASTEAAFVEINAPIIYISDATFEKMVNYESSFSNISNNSIFEGNYLEKKILNKSTYIMYPSEWPIQSAIAFYKIPKTKIVKAKFGSNFPNIDSEDELEKLYNHNQILKLLFIGVKWETKGGPIAIETLNELNKRNIKTELTVVGCSVPKNNLPGLNVISFLDKSNKNDLEKLYKLYRENHFFILPTRNEAVGIVFCESAQFGLPCITSNTGGIPDYVQDNYNGCLMDLNASGLDYANSIEKIWFNKDKYTQMRIAAKKKYTKELNWNSWGNIFKNVIEKI